MISASTGYPRKRDMKVAILGCGHMARTQIPYILKTGNICLLAICDQDKIRAKGLAQRYGLPCYANLAEMLKETQPDVVHVLTPPQTHAALTIQSLKAGCHVLVEKPLCLTIEEVHNIYTVAQSVGRLVSVDHSHLWSPLVQKAMEVANSDQLGRIAYIQYVIGDDYLEVVKQGYARWALELRGGVFCDLIPHPLYLICAFLPKVRVVSARARGTGISDLRDLWVNFTADSADANLWISLSQRPLEHSLRIYCTKGIIHIDLRNFCLAVIPERSLPGPIARVINTVSESWQRSMGTLGNVFGLLCDRFDPKAGTAGAIQTFYQAITEEKPPPVSMDDATAVVKLSTAIWDILEGTPGAIQLVVNEKGQMIVRKTPADFTKNTGYESPRVLVTGGTGFIGSHLVRQLVAEGRRVRVLCRSTSRLDALPTDGVELSFGDVSNFDSARQAMQGIEVLYHLAATTGGDWATHYQGTVVGTQNVLQAATEARVKKVVYVSSLGVLHASRFPNEEIVDENFPLEQYPEARGDYSRAKLEAERIAREFAQSGKLSLCIVRPGLVYGPGKTEFLSDAGFRVSNKLVLVVGMGNRQLGLTYVENLIDALFLAERNGCLNERIYHIVDPEQPTVRSYIQEYCKVSGEQLFVFYMPAFLWLLGLRGLDFILKLKRASLSHLTYRVQSIARGPQFDTSRVQKELGWISKVSFAGGMRKAFDLNQNSERDKTVK